MLTAIILAWQAGAAPQQLLTQALDAVEPPPALRASFTAMVEADGAMRSFSFDPFAEEGPRFRRLDSRGRSEDLDAIVGAWEAEGQADVRLFADDLRASLADARFVAESGGGWAIRFRHRISPNDGPVDAMISSNMAGKLTFNDLTGRLMRIDYGIVEPVRLAGGAVLTEYQQTYRFHHSERWNVSYVAAYDVRARGGKWGVRATRTLRVSIRDVTFGLAGDARQALLSRPPPDLSTHERAIGAP
jgi:hypothetical protein